MNKTTDDSPKGWALVWDYLKDKPIIGSAFTAILFFRNPRQVTRDAIAEDWKDKLKPPRFFIEAYLICLCILAITPFNNAVVGPEIHGDAKRHFLQFANVISYACSVFGGAMALHFTLNRKHHSAIHAFFAFCYLQGATLLLGYISAIPVFLIFGISPNKSLMMAMAVIGLPVFIATVIYSFIVVIELYHPKWYNFILGFLVGLAAYVGITICFYYSSMAIASRFPN